VADAFTPESRVDVGDGFTDVLSQYQTLEHAYRVERIRDLHGLLTQLNAAR
jgi:hypothetical protein